MKYDSKMQMQSCQGNEFQVDLGSRNVNKQNDTSQDSKIEQKFLNCDLNQLCMKSCK